MARRVVWVKLLLATLPVVVGVVVFAVVANAVITTAAAPIIKSQQVVESLVGFLGGGEDSDLSEEDRIEGARVLRCALAARPEAAAAAKQSSVPAEVFAAAEDWLGPATQAVPRGSDVELVWAWMLYRLANTPDPAAPPPTSRPRDTGGDAVDAEERDGVKPLMTSLPEFAVAYTGGTEGRSPDGQSARERGPRRWEVPVGVHTLVPAPRIQYRRVVAAAATGMQLLARQDKITLTDDDVMGLSLLVVQSCSTPTPTIPSN